MITVGRLHAEYLTYSRLIALDEYSNNVYEKDLKFGEYIIHYYFQHDASKYNLTTIYENKNNHAAYENLIALYYKSIL